MPRCVPLARRTRYPGETGTRGGWGGTPSESRVLDSWKAGRRILRMFPVGHEDKACLAFLGANWDCSRIAHGSPEEYLLRRLLLHSDRGDAYEKESGGLCVCNAARVRGNCDGSSQPGQQESADAHKIVHFGDLKWTPIIKGCDLAPVSGDPSAEGAPFVLRIRCADGTRVPAHWHPTDENVTVLKGTLLVGMGETFDESKLQTMNVGNFVLLPKEMRHFALCKGEMIVQLHGTGPFKNNWVNPSEVQPPDAPAAAAAKSKS